MTLADTLARRGVKLRLNGDKVSINCPWCPGRGKPADTKMRLCLHAKEGWGRCLHCDWSRRTAIAATLRQLGIQDAVTGGPSMVAAEPEPEPVELPEDFTPIDAESDGRDKMAYDYALGRGLTPGQVAARGLGVSYTRPWQYRVMFPVVADGKLRCINARDFTGRGKPKYLLSKGDKWLAYFDPAADCAVLSEGVIKALRLEQACAGGSCSAALLGHDLTDTQLGQVQRSACRLVVLWPDTDLVGRRGFIKVADRLAENWRGEVAVVWPVDGAADDLRVRDLKVHLMGRVEPYTARLRQRMLLVK